MSPHAILKNPPTVRQGYQADGIGFIFGWRTITGTDWTLSRTPE
jgi:hypothetical protein